MRVRRAEPGDLPFLVQFTQNEAREAEGRARDRDTLERGIGMALDDPGLALYWVLVDGSDAPVGNVSAVREWSNWHAGYYWWIQSMYLLPEQRGKGRMQLLINAVLEEMRRQRGLELRLYVHADNPRAIRAYEKSGFRPAAYRIMVLDG